MTRPIEFRGKRLDNGQWVYGSYHYIKGEGFTRQSTFREPYYEDIPVRFDYHIILVHNLPTMACWDDEDTFTSYEVDPETVGQFSGEYDMNNIKIFEGDRCAPNLNLSEETDFECVWKVSFRDGCFMARREDNTGPMHTLHTLAREVKVLDSIHDQPELLKGAQNE